MTTTATVPFAVLAPPSDRRLHRLLLVLVMLAAAVLHARAIGNGFVNYDDPVYITDAPVVRQGLTIDGIVWAFGGFRFFNYHPLTWLSHMLDVELFGVKPAGHHATSVLLHAAAAGLLYAALRRMTGLTVPSAFVAALFALHPLRVESVAWIAERKDVLSVVFFCLTLYAYSFYVRAPRRLTYALTLLAYAVGLLAKQTAVTLPFVLLLLDAWPLRRATDPDPVRRRSVKQLVIEKVPFLLLAAVLSAVIATAQASGAPLKSTADYPFAGRLANAVVAYPTYLWKTVWPFDLAVFYPYPESFPFGRVAVAATVLVGLTAAVLWQGSRRPYLAVGWFWFLGMLVPMIGLVQVGRQSMADRYAYLPHVGLFVAVVWLACDLAGRFPGGLRAAAWAGVAVLLALSIRTWHQIGYWEDSVSLFTHAADVTDDNFIAHHQLANELARGDRLDEAEHHYKQALAASPDHQLSWLNLGRLQVRRGRFAEAVATLKRANEIKPELAGTHVALGVAMANGGGTAEAAAVHFARAVEIDPRSASARVALGRSLWQRGMAAQAAEQFGAALEIDPNHREAKAARDQIGRTPVIGR